MPNPEAIRLRHMREAAAAALELANGRERLNLSRNLMLAMALTRCLEILGEAASKIGPETRQRFPRGRPWHGRRRHCRQQPAHRVPDAVQLLIRGAGPRSAP
jgi:uncharacterized protein with HEPN domain